MAIQQAIHDVTEEIKIVKEKIEDEERQTPVDRDMLRALNQQLAALREKENRLSEVVAEALVLPAAGAQPGSGAAVFRPVGQQTFNDGMIQHTNAVVEDVRQELRQERQERRQEKQELTDRLAAMEEQLKQGRMHLKAH